MKIAIKEIIVEEDKRIRQETGDLKSLQASIEEVGLINPLLIDENKTLIAGFRRLSACKNLGWQEVDVKIVEFNGDPIKMLGVEVAENYFRKDFTPEEIIAAERRRLEIIESQRKKGFFERLWLWLKSLFQSAPVDAPVARPTEASVVAPVNTTGAPEPQQVTPVQADVQAEETTQSVKVTKDAAARSAVRSPASKSIFPLDSETLKR